MPSLARAFFLLEWIRIDAEWQVVPSQRLRARLERWSGPGVYQTC